MFFGLFWFWVFCNCAHRLLGNYNVYLLFFSSEADEINLQKSGSCLSSHFYTQCWYCTLIPLLCVLYVFSYIITGHVATAGQFKAHLIYFTPRQKYRRVLEYWQGVQSPRWTLCEQLGNTTDNHLKVILGLPAFISPLATLKMSILVNLKKILSTLENRSS